MEGSFLSEREALYFVFQRGCHACEEAEPELDKFIARHPGMMVLRLQANGGVVDSLGVKIKATPTYVYRRGQRGVVQVGAMNAKELEAWIKGAAQAL